MSTTPAAPVSPTGPPTAPTDQPTTDTTQVYAAADKPLNIGLFDTKDPNAWFYRAEMMFRIRGTISEKRKAELVLECLPPACWNVVSKFFDDHQGSPTYTQVKEELLEHWDTKPAARAKQFFAYLGASAGEMNVSSMYHTLQNLITIPKSTTRNKSPVDLVMEMTLQLYPKNVRAQMPDYLDTDLKTFFRRADKIIASYNEPPTITAATTPAPHTEDPSSDPESEVAAPLKMKSVVVKPEKTRQTKKQREICYYHRRFGPKAFRCQSPCDWTPKNA